MPIDRALIVDDDLLMRQFLAEALSRKKITVDQASCGKEALLYLKQNSYELLLTDLKMPDINGIELLKKVKLLSPATCVIIMTAYGSVDNAVDAMRIGAFHYILKPFSFDTLDVLIEKAAAHLDLVQENVQLREQIPTSAAFIAKSPAMQNILKNLTQIAKSNASVLVHGESGTGKEVIASHIHHLSPRAPHPYIRVNCAAIAETLLESEFFGHEKGAFTGAHIKRLGRFELADKGTLFLDEVTEIPLHLQPKLLRVIQEREFERVGGSKPLTVDVRLIASSNRDLKQAIKEKIFREDLFYRLNVIPIYLPPLRERKDDILPLTNHFLAKFCQENRALKKRLTPQAEAKLLGYEWPGNIRELANVIERACVIDPGASLDAEHLHL